MFDPTSLEDMAEKIWDVWNDQARMSFLKKKGLERAGIFNWNATAHKTLEVYRKALS
jgi:glycosyltransferase involved in cell wall biosynthesis